MQSDSPVNQARQATAQRHVRCAQRKVRNGVLAVLALAVLAGGCTTLQAVDLPPEELREALRNGEVSRRGETVVLVTANREHTVEFVEVDAAADVVRGRADDGTMVSVAVEDIVVLRSVDAAAGRSTLLGIAIAAVIVLSAIAADAVEDFVEIFEP